MSNNMIEIPIIFETDDKGYIERECPNENCMQNFKVYAEDWNKKIAGNMVHCPMCGHVDSVDKWYTQEQVESMQERARQFALSYIHNKLSNELKRHHVNSVVRDTVFMVQHISVPVVGITQQ